MARIISEIFHPDIVSAKTCPHCGGLGIFRKSSNFIYASRDYGPVWICSNYPHCNSYVKCHPGTQQSLGRLSNDIERTLKIQAHYYLDALWKRKIAQGVYKNQARGLAYDWLSQNLGLSRQNTHLGYFDRDFLNDTIDLCLPWFSISSRLPQHRNIKGKQRL